MFTGIIEEVVEVKSIEIQGSNKVFYFLRTKGIEDLYIDQSIAHNGVCLTVIEILADGYKVEAINETLKVTNLNQIKAGDMVNLELSTKLGSRIDGHMVQGHVDTRAETIDISDEDGSWLFRFAIPKEDTLNVIPKGSITINGISLTIQKIDGSIITVAIIPYTYEHTNLSRLVPGDSVNIEFDVIGKYVNNYLQKINS